MGTTTDDDVLVLRSARISLATQAFLGLISLVGFFGVSYDDDNVLLGLLIMDTTVQLVEFAFYAYMVRVGVLDTWYRYIDWFITTPVMLLSTIILMEHLNDPTTTFGSFFADYWRESVYVVLNNALMLAFGLASERGWIVPRSLALSIGFLPFVSAFAIVLGTFARTPSSAALGASVFFVWSLYGVVAFWGRRNKNIGYNALDVVSKNFYGVLVSVLILIE
jgi:bacteriorhodopsin